MLPAVCTIKYLSQASSLQMLISTCSKLELSPSGKIQSAPVEESGPLPAAERVTSTICGLKQYQKFLSLLYFVCLSPEFEFTISWMHKVKGFLLLRVSVSQNFYDKNSQGCNFIYSLLLLLGITAYYLPLLAPDTAVIKLFLGVSLVVTLSFYLSNSKLRLGLQKLLYIEAYNKMI